jgi:hypothetical protein
MPGKPLTRAAQITNETAVAQAVDALIYGRDEPRRDTTAKGWNTSHYGEGVDAMKMWYEELQDIDMVISEAEEVNPTILPTGSLVERIEAAAEKMSTWYAAAVPVYQKRLLHIRFDELAEVAGDLRGGKINAAEAEARFDSIMAEVEEIVDFSRFMGD